MSISPETIDKVRLSTDIAELVREYLPNLKKVGRNWKTNCPFHKEKTPSFMVSAEKGIFHCFGCGSGGDAFKFVTMMDNISWPEAVRKLADRSGIVIKETHEEIAKRSQKQEIYDILEQAAKFYHRYLVDSDEGKPAREYLNKRGINSESIEKFQIGFSSAGCLVSAAAKKNISKEQLLSAGLITKTDKGRFFEYMQERIVFPIYDAQGRVVAFGGRTLKDEQPKYLNTPETSVYSKSHQLYGLFHAIPQLRTLKEVIVLEGYIDVVASHQFGVANAVATLGTALTSQQGQILNRYCEKAILLFDSDDAGRAAAKRAIENLIDTELALIVSSLPEGMDSDEFLIKHGKDEFIKHIAAQSRSAIEYLTEQAIAQYGIAAPEAKVKVSRELSPIVEKAKSSVLRGEWIKYIAEKLRISETDLQNEWQMRKKSAGSKKAGHENPSKQQKQDPVRSAEEELLQLMIAYPQYRSIVHYDVFSIERNSRIFLLLLKDVQIPDIINSMDESEASWFTELAMEEKLYSFPDQIIVNIVRDLKKRQLEMKRQELKKEVSLMIDGQIPEDSVKIKLYQDLNRQLKGSARL